MAQAPLERRLAAILAADVVGYSRLMERDEADTFRRLKTLQEELILPVLRRHGGQLVELKGDGSIVEFRSAVAAIEAAAEIQRALPDRERHLPEERRLRYRIGVNLGEVIADAGTIYGDGVNVAARIEALCEPDGIWLSRSVHAQVQGKADLAFAPTGRHRVKNLSEPIETFRVVLDGVVPSPVSGGGNGFRPGRRALPAAGALLACLLALAAWWLWPAAAPARRAPAIAVLPFANLGGDAATGRLADGLTEDVITDLAGLRDLDVIARNSTEAFRDRPVDVRSIGRELNVGYVLEGSIQRQAERVRVTAQLIDAATGVHLWAERWDRPAEDLFAVQTEVAERAANSLIGVVAGAALASARHKHPQNLAAYDLVLLGHAVDPSGPQAPIEQGLADCQAAIAKDPGYAPAYVCKAWRLLNLTRFNGRYNETYGEMERLARQAIALDPYNAWAHLTLGLAASAQGRNADGLQATERAIELAPSYAAILNQAADNMPFFGRPEQGAALCDRSFRLDPDAPAWFSLNCITSYFLAGRPQDAVQAASRAGGPAALNPQLLVWLAGSLAELGRDQEAAATLAELRRRRPDVSFENLLNTGWSFERQRDQDRILAAVRKAGLRVCATAVELADFPAPRRLPECGAP